MTQDKKHIKAAKIDWGCDFSVILLQESIQNVAQSSASRFYSPSLLQLPISVCHGYWYISQVKRLVALYFFLLHEAIGATHAGHNIEFAERTLSAGWSCPVAAAATRYHRSWIGTYEAVRHLPTLHQCPDRRHPSELLAVSCCEMAIWT